MYSSHIQLNAYQRYNYQWYTYVRVTRKFFKTFLDINFVSLFQTDTTTINYIRNNTMGDNKSMTGVEISDLTASTNYSKANRSTTNTNGTPSVSAKQKIISGATHAVRTRTQFLLRYHSKGRIQTSVGSCSLSKNSLTNKLR